MSVPDGFTLVLPDDWVTLDLDPDTRDATQGRLIDALVREDPSVAEYRDDVAAVLSAAAAGAAEDSALLCALRFDVGPDRGVTQATVLVAVRAVEGSSEPTVLVADIHAAGFDAEVVDLAAGPAVRLVDRTEEGMLTFGALVPVPGVEGRLVIVSLSSPSLTEEAQLSKFFDALADTFAFTWETAVEALG